MRSLRTRLVLLTMLGTTLVLGTTGWFIHSTHRSHLFGLFDASLETTATNVAKRIHHDGVKGVVTLVEERSETPDDAELAEYTVKVYDTGPDVIYESKPEGADEIELVIGELAENEIVEVKDEEGSLHRVYLLPVIIEQGEHVNTEETHNELLEETITGSLVVSAKSEHIHLQSHSLARLILHTSLASIALAGLIAWATVGYGLKPLGALARRISETTPQTLNTKISVDHQPSEIAPVVDRLNDLLGNLDEAIVRERTLSTNVAHELRTPVAALISTLEVRLNENLNSEDEQILRECLSVAQGMESVVGSLLTLSRLESGQMKSEPTDTSVVETLNDIWPTVERRSVTLHIDTDADLVLHTDRNLLRIAFSNALANAAQHAPDGSNITVSAQQVKGSKIVTIQNEGCTLDPADADKVFDRFWREDKVRSVANLHCGLGATLIRQASEAAGAVVSARVDGGKFILSFKFSD